jgi:pimeloyl-ACP methyl ester carboxylesterase
LSKLESRPTMAGTRSKYWIFLLILFTACTGPVGRERFSSEIWVGSNRTLVVMLPTMGGDGSFYESRGFIQELRDRGFSSHCKVLNVDPSLYLNRRIVDLLKSEVIDPAKADGYEKIWLLGISLGGHGALLYLSEYPEDIYATVVLAPFVADPLTTRLIQKEGGLKEMKKCPDLAWGYACNMLTLIKKYLGTPGNERRLALGFGTDDAFARQNRMLAELIAPDQIFIVQGGRHDWNTWKKLFDQVLDYIEKNRIG